MVIDSHVQFWKYDKKKDSWLDSSKKTLRSDQLPEHLSLSLKRNDVDGCIAVNPGHGELQTRFLAELSKTHPVVKAVVGWIPLGPGTFNELQQFNQYDTIRGWTWNAEDNSESPGVIAGLQAIFNYDYTIDILAGPSQYRKIINVLEKFPDKNFILDHGGLPGIAANQPGEWNTMISELSMFPNLHCKLSGFFTQAKWKEWSAGDFYPYLDHLFKKFESSRLLFGSDWPLILLSGIYVQWKSLLEKYMEEFPGEDRQKVFGENAVRLYKL